MKKSIVILFVLFLAVVSLFAKGKFNLPVKNLVIQTVDGKEFVVNTEIASKTEERNYGFMNRKKIPEGTGMLFVFREDQILSFWMKNTPTPLSIAYIDSAGVIRDIYDMTPFSEASIKSTRSVRYALEVPQGWYKKNGISVGDKLILDGKDK